MVDPLAVVRPTWVATPRQLEEIRGRADAATGRRAAATAAERAYDAARQVRDREAEEERVPRRLARRHRRLDKRVLSDVRELFGDRLRFVVTPASASTRARRVLRPGRRHGARGLRPARDRGRGRWPRPVDRGSGTAGRPLPGTEVRLAEGGEILVSGPGLMEGYHRRRHDTAAALDKGWLAHRRHRGARRPRAGCASLGRLVRTPEA